MKNLQRCNSVEEYLRSVQKTAMTRFPQTFLNKEEIAKNAGDAVLERIRKEALVWIAAIAVIFSVMFSVIQLVSNYLRTSPLSATSDDLLGMRMQIENLKITLDKI